MRTKSETYYIRFRQTRPRSRRVCHTLMWLVDTARHRWRHTGSCARLCIRFLEKIYKNSKIIFVDRKHWVFSKDILTEIAHQFYNVYHFCLNLNFIMSYVLPPQSFSSELSPTPQSMLPSHLKVLGMHFPLSQVNSCSAHVYALKKTLIPFMKV